MTLNTRTDYDDSTEGQGSKSFSLLKAGEFVNFIYDTISPLLTECIKYESKKMLGKAPCVELPNGKLAIAPDLRCITKQGNVFWIEVKDKSQRFYHPDTGADIFQVYGWYNIYNAFNEPVLVVFKDPDFQSCLPRNPIKEKVVAFKNRWDKFSGKPYGNWLSSLIVLDNKYPRVFYEHSRDMEMYIMYFKVDRMDVINDWEEVIRQVDEKNIPALPEELKCYLAPNNEIINQEKIRELIVSLFKR